MERLWFKFGDFIMDRNGDINFSSLVVSAGQFREMGFLISFAFLFSSSIMLTKIFIHQSFPHLVHVRCQAPIGPFGLLLSATICIQVLHPFAPKSLSLVSCT